MKLTLLYFDDDKENLECYKDFFSEIFELIGINDPLSFPRHLEDQFPHAILIDVHMPVMNGHQLFGHISQHPLYNGCPLIFISGDESDEIRLKSLREGGVDFISRNVRIEELVARINNAMKFFLERSTILGIGNFSLNVSLMKASIGKSNLDLTLLELRILSCILRHYPGNLSREELIQKIWGNDSVKPGTINTHLTNLKPKIEAWNYQIRIRDENIILQKKEG